MTRHDMTNWHHGQAKWSYLKVKDCAERMTPRGVHVFMTKHPAGDIKVENF